MGNEQCIQVSGEMPDQETTAQEHPVEEASPNMVEATTETTFGEESMVKASSKQTEIDNVSLMSVAAAMDTADQFSNDQSLGIAQDQTANQEELLTPDGKEINGLEVKAEGAKEDNGQGQTVSGALGHESSESGESLTSVQEEENKVQKP